jgi:hypothetical protein
MIMSLENACDDGRFERRTGEEVSTKQNSRRLIKLGKLSLWVQFYGLTMKITADGGAGAKMQ